MQKQEMSDKWTTNRLLGKKKKKHLVVNVSRSSTSDAHPYIYSLSSYIYKIQGERISVVIKISLASVI